MSVLREKKKILTELRASLTQILFPAELFKSIKNVLIDLGQTQTKFNTLPLCPGTTLYEFSHYNSSLQM